MQKRKYEKTRRALKQEGTRERIVEALMALHEELGPAATTVSAIAERAGVQRLTVYRHFPDEASMLAACTSTWLGRHPPPDPAAIAASGAEAYTRALLLALYSYYEATAGMWTSAYRDLEKVPALAEAMQGFDAYLAVCARLVLQAWAPRRSRRLSATVAHTLRFSTWQSLAAEGLRPRAMMELASTWIAHEAVPAAAGNK